MTDQVAEAIPRIERPGRNAVARNCAVAWVLAAVSVFALSSCESAERSRAGKPEVPVTTNPGLDDPRPVAPWRLALSTHYSGGSIELLEANATDGSICFAVRPRGVQTPTTTIGAEDADALGLLDGLSDSCVPRPSAGSRSVAPIQLAVGKESDPATGEIYVGGVAAASVSRIVAVTAAGEVAAQVGRDNSFLVVTGNAPVQVIAFEIAGSTYRCPIDWFAGAPVDACPFVGG